jgi:DNA-binding SARP family transcriptional activator
MVDWSVFQRGLAADAVQPIDKRLEQLRHTADLYQGEFMAGFVLKDAPEFDTWQLAQPFRLRRAYTGLLAELAQQYRQQGEWEAALTYARRWVSLDPLHEPAQHLLLNLYQAAGRTTEAEHHYQLFSQQMMAEMGVLPDWTTETVFSIQ